MVCADLDFCDLMVGGPVIDGAEVFVDLEGDTAVGVVSSAVAAVASSAYLAWVASPTDIAGTASSAVAEVASSAGAEVASSAIAEVAPSAVGEVASSAVSGVAFSTVAEAASLADAEMASLADAGVASPADIAEVASLADIAGVDPTDVAFQGWCDSVCDYDDYFIISVVMRTLTILIMMIRRILIVTLMCIVVLNRMTIGCFMIFMDRMIVECIVWPGLRLVGRPTGLVMRTVLTVQGTLLCPRPGPVNRLTCLLVLPDRMNRLAVLGQAGLGIGSVTSMGEMLPCPGEPFDSVSCTSGQYELVGYVSISWSGIT